MESINQYHERRASEEHARADAAADRNCRDLHNELARLHADAAINGHELRIVRELRPRGEVVMTGAKRA